MIVIKVKKDKKTNFILKCLDEVDGLGQYRASEFFHIPTGLNPIATIFASMASTSIRLSEDLHIKLNIQQQQQNWRHFLQSKNDKDLMYWIVQVIHSIALGIKQQQMSDDINDVNDFAVGGLLTNIVNIIDITLKMYKTNLSDLLDGGQCHTSNNNNNNNKSIDDFNNSFKKLDKIQLAQCVQKQLSNKNFICLAVLWMLSIYQKIQSTVVGMYRCLMFFSYPQLLFFLTSQIRI